MRARVAAALVVACVVAGCSKSERYVAKLEHVESSVERSPTENAAWRPAAVGDGFVLGSAVRTGPTARARLRVGASGKLEVDPNAIVRFTRHATRATPEISLEAGTIELEAGAETLAIGDAVLEPGGRAQATFGPDGTQLKVMFGELVLEDEGDARRVVKAGDAVAIDRNAGAVAARAPVDASVPERREPASTELSVAVSGAPAQYAGPDGATPLAIGSYRLAAGTALSVPKAAVVEISTERARAVVTGPAELSLGGADGLVTLRRGDLSLRAVTGDARGTVPGGTIAASADGSEIHATTGKGSTQIDVVGGDGSIVTSSATERIAAGDVVTLSADGKLELVSRAPARAMFSIIAGESPVIHGPVTPLPVRVRFPDTCTGGGSVEIAKDAGFKRVVARSGGRGPGANVLLPAGVFSYRVRCGDANATTGTVRLTRDTGRASLPKAAARTQVEADGREYTILYENLLPEITLSWRGAPPGAVAFNVKSRHGAARRFPGASSKVTLRPGQLGEGRYEFWAESTTTKRRSDTTHIVIDFNNAAASASIESVDVAGGKVRVRGVVIEDSTVSASGTPVELDRHRRFATELAPAADEDGVALRISHPKLGVHYYAIGAGPRDPT